MSNPAFSLAGKVAVITGSSRGIGYAAARAIGLAGGKVVVSSRKAEVCAAAVEALSEVGIEALAVPAHAGREDDVARLIAETLARFGRIDILVANAGINPSFDPLTELGDETWDKVLAMNLGGPRLLARHGMAHLAASGDGAFVAVSSINAAVGFARSGAYGIAKAGLEAMVRLLAAEWGPQGVRVNCVRPGTIRTDMIRSLADRSGFLDGVAAGSPLGRIGEPEDVGNVIAFLASGAARHVTAQVLTVDGGGLAYRA